jgi:hypothetical protein
MRSVMSLLRMPFANPELRLKLETRAINHTSTPPIRSDFCQYYTALAVAAAVE